MSFELGHCETTVGQSSRLCLWQRKNQQYRSSHEISAPGSPPGQRTSGWAA